MLVLMEAGNVKIILGAMIIAGCRRIGCAPDPGRRKKRPLYIRYRTRIISQLTSVDIPWQRMPRDSVCLNFKRPKSAPSKSVYIPSSSPRLPNISWMTRRHRTTDE
jgi:hypothetical protein